MPVIHTQSTPLREGNRPPWCDITSAGIFSVPCGGGSFDCHYHDCDEYWLIFAGKAKVLSEGQFHYVQRGDILCTKAGEEHDVLEVYEDLEAYWFEGATPAGGRVGHLHKTPEKAAGHPVPARPVPGDFTGCKEE